jgi:hypothetical protein
MSAPKVTTEQVAKAAQAIGLPDAERRKLLEMLADMQPEEKEKHPAVKKQFVVLLSDPLGQMPKTDFVAWVFQIPENENVATTEDRIRESAYTFNASKKGRLLPVQTIGEGVENIPARIFRERDLWVKTKTAVLVCVTNNEIPRTPGGRVEGITLLEGTRRVVRGWRPIQ